MLVLGLIIPASVTNAATLCVTSSPTGNCGPYAYGGITNSNGFNTYVSNNCWADPKCAQTVRSSNPGNWSVTAREPAGNTGVKTYPDVQQLFNDWNGHGWNGSGTLSDTPIGKLGRLVSVYGESTPFRGTIAQAAYDIWLSSNTGHPSEIMIWVDNHNRGSGGAQRKAAATIYGQRWTLYQYGNGELIWSLGKPGTFARQTHGTVHILAMLRWLRDHGYISPGARIGQLDFGWEICSTGGISQRFGVNRYRIDTAP